MRKVKIMLTAITILATVGGVLAFKAKRSQVICWASTINGMCPPNLPCDHWTIGKTTLSGGILRCTTTGLNHADCLTKICPVLARTTQEQ